MRKPRKIIVLAEDLSRGERLYLRRQRLGTTQIEAAVNLGVCLAEYRAMEVDDPMTKCPYTSVGKLAPHEQYMIKRRRLGYSRPALAAEMGVSAFWLRQMEKGVAPIRSLVKFWENISDGE